MIRYNVRNDIVLSGDRGILVLGGMLVRRSIVVPSYISAY